MGRLKALTIILMLGAGGGATEGAPRDDAADQPPASARPPLPKPAAEYLRAAAYLQNSGRAEMAAKYLQVAQEYRDELTSAEQTVLDEYMRKLAPAPAPAPAPAEFAPAPREWANAPGSVPASVPVPGRTAEPAVAQGPNGQKVMTLEGRTGSVDSKQQARWLLANAVDLMRQGKYDEANTKVAEARGLNAKWTLFEDSPDKVAKAIEKARGKAGPAATAAAAPAGGRDRKMATLKLKQARELIKSGQYEQAEAVARDVDSWGLSYGFWDEKPSAVITAAQALRRRDTIRKTGPLNRPSNDAYDSLVAEARQMLAAGRLAEAETKATQAQRLGVVPSVTSDRAESVLQAVQLVKSQAPRTPAGVAVASNPVAPPPIAESPAALMEREADALLARQDAAAAAAKYAQADQYRARESAEPPPLLMPPAGDAAFQVAGAQGVPGQIPAEPIPAAPAGMPDIPNELPAAPQLDVPSIPSSPALEGGSQGEHLLNTARAFHEGGNFAAARETANRVRNGGYGLEAAADELLSQIALKQQGAALALYEEALAAVRSGDPNEMDHARVLLQEVASAGVLDESLQQRVQDLMLKIGSGRAAQAPIDARADEEAVAAQRLIAEVAVKVGEARRLMEVDPDKGIASLQETLVIVKAAEVPEASKRQMTRRLEVALELAKKDKVAFDFKMKDKNARAEIEQKKLRILEADKAKQARVKEYMQKSIAAFSDGKYDEAESWALRAQEVDPMDVAATAQAWKSRAKRGYEREKEIRRDKERGVIAAFQDVEASSIIDPVVLKNGVSMPKSFAELTEMRRRTNSRLETKTDPARMVVVRKLEESLSFDMDKQPLSEVITYLQNATGLNVVLDPKALLETGLTEASPVSLRVNTKLKTALKLMLAPLGLTWDIEGDVLLITSPQNNAKVVEVVYPVGDLILAASKRKTGFGNTSFPGMNGNMTQTPDPNGTSPTGVPGQGSSTEALDYQALDFTPLMSVITSTIAPGTWRMLSSKGEVLTTGNSFGMGAGFGGGGALGGDDTPPPGSIIPYPLSISLIIRHTPEVHEDIVELLRQLRKLQDLQVSVEVRFITVNDNFFERIGVDFDFAIQSDINPRKNAFIQTNPAAVPVQPGQGGNTGGGGTTTSVSPFLVNPNFSRYVQGNRLPLVVGTNGPGDTGTPRLSQDLNLPFTQDSYTLTNPFNAQPGAGGSFGIAFLSDLDVYLFITAAQGDTRSNIVQAPKVTTFNGAQASVFNGRLINYVSALIPVVNFGAVAFTPIPSQIFDGVNLAVVPVVSADRRYVRLTMTPTFQTIDGFDTFPVPAAVGGGGIGGGSASITGQIQLPRTNNTTVDTTVTVPDGGTVLLGGVKRLREERSEYGVPILSKTPLINRLFRNVGIGRTTDSLMVMVTPRIIILEEEEERLGIPALAPTP